MFKVVESVTVQLIFEFGEKMEITPALAAVIGGACGAAVTSLFAFFTQLIVRRSDERKHLLDLVFKTAVTNWEKDLDCALREFEEETGISANSVTVIDNILPFDEYYIGSNHKQYKHKYFLAYMHNDIDCHMQNFQTTEVSKLEWKSIDECLQSIRPYNLEKKRIIQNINEIVKTHSLFTI